MRKIYPQLSIAQSDQSIVLETSIQKIFKRTLLFFIFYLCTITTSSAQCNTDVPLPFIESSYGNLTSTSNIDGLCLLCSAPNPSRLTDNNLNNFSTATVAVGVGATSNYRVTDNDTDYAAGTYVGYQINTGGLLSINLLGSITIKTYLNGNPRESVSGSSLLGTRLLNTSGNNHVVGFNTTKSFDAIEISVGSLASLLNTIDVYYPVIRNYCTGWDLNCNTPTAMSLPAYPVSIESSHTGISGTLAVGNIYDAKNVISTNTNDYATISLIAGLAASGSIAVKDQLTDYPAGTYAGFEIENSNLLSVSALGNVKITTYLNGAQQQQFLGNNLVVNGSLLNNSGRYKVGFVSTTSFDEVQISINQLAGVNLGSTRVYNAVFQKFCAGPDLNCNTQTAMTSPTYPVYINGENTGIDGLACVSCSVDNVENLIDQNATNFAQINLTAAIGNSASISVKDQITNYPIGSFAGFTMENPSLLNVNALDAVMIRTYLDGTLQETKFGNSALAIVGTNLFVGTSPQTIGFVSTQSFDEVRLTILNTATVSLGTIKVYDAVFQKLCPVTLECNKTYALTNPTFSVTIDSDKTGVDGLICVACAVNNTNNVLTPSTTDFASILVTAGVIAPASIAVHDQLSTYPSGTFAGFTIRDLNSLVQLDLFSSLTISTYLDGAFRESQSASLLLNLSLLTPYGSGLYNVGFQTTQSFDEIRISVGSLASVINDIHVYGAFVNTSGTSGGTLFCATIEAVDDPLSPIIGASGNVNAGNVLSNDTLNGNPATINDVNITLVTAATPINLGAPVPVIDPLTGIVSIPEGTPAGNYSIVYQICYKSNSLTCDSATVTITVTAAAIDAINDNNSTNTIVYGSTGGNTGIDVYANDTLNGNPVNPSDVILTSTPNGPLTVNTDGSVVVAPNTPGGTYTVNYTICEKLNPKNCDTATVTVFVAAPSIAVVKVGAVGGSGTVNDLITYSFAVTNTGNTTLTNVVINDALTGSVDLDVNPSTLTAGATGMATATYTIKQIDVDNGKVTNTATVTGTTPDNGTVTDISGTTITNNTPTETTLTPNSSIALVKIGSVGGTGTSGDIITYTFEVTNTGNTTLSAIVINDALTGSVDLAITPSTLAPNATGIATATYMIQLADVNLGEVTNTATVEGTTPAGGTVTDTSGTTITNDTPTITTLTPSPNVALVKTAVVGGTGEVGYTITYTFTITNTGNTSLSGIVINDPLTGSINLAVSPSTLLPNTTGTATATYTIQQSDMDAGKVTNIATVTATTPTNGTVTDTSGTAVDNNTPTVVTLNPISSVALVKTAAIGGTGAVGELITYTFTVKNTGNTTLSAVAINDILTTSANLAVTPSVLLPNASGIATATYMIQQSDMDAGKVTNTATVTATTPTNGTVNDTSGTTITNDTPTVTTLNPSSSIALVKTAIIGGTGTVDDVITYTFTVTNTGNTTLNTILINDILTASVDLVITPSILLPNTSGIATATYTIKQSDMDAGKITNTATVTATTPTNGTVTDTSGTTITNDTPTITKLTPNPGIALVKTGVVNGTGAVDDTITYTFTVTNTGDTTLSAIVVNDPLTESENLLVIPSTLAPNTSGIATATYTIKQSDIDAEKVTNTATATGVMPSGGTVTDTSGTTITNDTPTVTPLNPSPSIALVKTAVIGGSGLAGDLITYTFTVTNTGNTTLNSIIINDPLTGSVNLSVTPSTLLPDETGMATATYTIQQSDIIAGKVINSATAIATTPTNGTVTDISGTAVDNDTPTDTSLIPNPSINITKEGVYTDTNNDGIANVGDAIMYSFIITNTGNLILSNITITDNNITTLTGTLTTLAVGASDTTSFTGHYMLTDADIESGYVYNSATVTADTPINTTVTAISTDLTPCISCPITFSCLDCTITTVPQTPSIALMKEGEFNDSNNDGYAQIGETISYTFTVMNTGNLALTNVIVTDDLPGVLLSGSSFSLAVGETNTTAYSAIYHLTQQDIINGSVSNQAIVKATNAANIEVTDMSDDNNALEDEATVLSVSGCVIEVFNAVSPGSDGHHDFFEIQGIECYPKNSVEIYNRWGIKVYDMESYDNAKVAFRGVSEGRGTVSQSEGLPTGTYFYIIKYQDLNNNGIDKSGYLELNRD